MSAEGSFESIVERQIAEAAERGEFEDLPGQGRPIPGLDRPYDPAWWAKRLVQREQFAMNGRKSLDEVEARLTSVWALRSVTAVRTAIADLNKQLEAHGATPFEVGEIVTLWKRFAIFQRGR